MQIKKTSYAGLVNYKDRIEKGEFNHKRSQAEYMKLNDFLIKAQRVMKECRQEAYELDLQIQKLSEKRGAYKKKQMEATVKFQKVNTIMVSSLRIVSGKLTKIELEVVNVLKTRVWKGQKFDIENPPQEFMLNETYREALERFISRIS